MITGDNIASLQDAARKALEGMFKGKKDVLASFDTGGSDGGGGSRGPRRKGTGGGGEGFRGGGWQLPNWRQMAAAGGRRIAGGTKSVFALLGFVGEALLRPNAPS